MVWIYCALIFCVGWGLTTRLRHAVERGGGPQPLVTHMLFSMPLGWCAGYTAIMTATWIVMQSVALVSTVEPSLEVVSWGMLLILAAIALPAWREERSAAPSRGVQRFSFPLGYLVCGIWLVAIGMTFGTTAVADGVITVPIPLRGDLFSHITLTRSFSSGYNFPTEYPFLQGEGIRYHFLFYFGGGVLEALGAPLTVALNLPSMLGLGSFLSLVAFVAWRLSGSLFAAAIGPLLCLFRSSFSWIDWVRSVVSKGGEAGPQGAQPFLYGVTPYEDWGIFSLSVHLNQRHLMYGFAWMLLALSVCLFTPPIRRPVSWPMARACAFFGALVGCGAYWNGAAFLSAVMVLAPLVLLKQYRAITLLILIPAACSSVFIVSLVTYGALLTTPFQPFLRFGFLSPSQALFDVLGYGIWLFGVLPIVAWVGGRRYGSVGLFLFAAGLLVIAVVFFAQITPFAPQGHKFVNAGVVLWSIVGAGLVASMWTAPRLRTRLSGQCLFILLTLTGITDLGGVVNLWRVTRSFPIDDPAIRWIESHTGRKGVFLSAFRGDNPIYMGGRRAFLGPPRLVSDAGHAYEERIAWVQEVASRGPIEQVRALREKGIAYVANDRCPNNSDGLQDPCPSVPGVDTLMQNPLLVPVYVSPDFVVRAVPKD